jgi:signal transduction histidine kinase
MILIILLSFLQNSDYQLCQGYYNNYQDDSLRIHLELIQNSNDQEVQFIYQLYNAKLYRGEGRYADAIEQLYGCLALYKRPMDSLYIADVYDELAMNLKYLGVLDRDKALEYINTSISIRQRYSSADIDRSLSIKGGVLFMIGSYGDIESHKREYLDQAIRYYNESIELAQFESLKSSARDNIVSAFIELEDYESALSMLDIQDSIGYQTNSNEIRILSQLKRVGLHCITSDYDLALGQLKSTRREYFDEMSLAQKSTMYTLYHDVYDSLNMDKKVIAYLDTLHYFDHLIFDEKNYEAEQKYRNALLESDLEVERGKVVQNRLIALILAGASLILLVLVALINRIRKVRAIKSRALLEKEKLNAQIRAVSARAAGEQSERLAIANKLHDEISSMLTAASFMVEGSKKSLNVDTISKAGDLIKNVSKQVRNISHELVSPTLMKLGFFRGLEAYVESISGGKFIINTEIDGPVLRYEFSKEQFLYQSTIELIQNAMKYGSGNSIEVKIKHKNDQVSVIVSNAISTDHQFGEDGLGTLNIISRAEAFGGEFLRTNSDDLISSVLMVPVK